jgi:hypothetical protein
VSGVAAVAGALAEVLAAEPVDAPAAMAMDDRSLGEAFR